MLPTPNFQISKDCEVKLTSGQFETLKAWSFVRPIDYQNLPAHIKQTTPQDSFELKNYSFCYTIYGIVLIPDNIIEKV